MLLARKLSRPAPGLVSLLLAVAFFFWFPHDNDLLASFARESAAAHGVGLTYWFSWFAGGTTPGQYSLLTPWVTVVLGVPLTAAAAPLATTVLAYRATRGLPHAIPTVWIATVAAWLNMWSGRVPFGLGCAAIVVVCIAVRERHWTLLIVSSVLSVAFSPVSGAFVVLGLVAVILSDSSRRRLALTAALTVSALLVAIEVVFGQPGPQPYSLAQATTTAVLLMLFLLARPVRLVSTLIVLSAVCAIAVSTFANGLGSNMDRIAWICLPALVIASARASRKVAIAVVLPALVVAAQSTVGGLIDSRQPAQQYGFYTGLGHRLDAIADLAGYRVEVVQDGSVHMNAYALLPHAALARGWETQADNRYDSVLLSRSKTLDASTYRQWLDDNAVGYVAYAHSAVHHDPERDFLRSTRLPYLQSIWTDSDWTLYRVREPVAIVRAPNRIIAATQATMTIRSTCSCSFLVRVHYSRYLVADPLQAHATATVRQSGDWVSVNTSAPGLYKLHGTLSALFR